MGNSGDSERDSSSRELRRNSRNSLVLLMRRTQGNSAHLVGNVNSMAGDLYRGATPFTWMWIIHDPPGSYKGAASRPADLLLHGVSGDSDHTTFDLELHHLFLLVIIYHYHIS